LFAGGYGSSHPYRDTVDAYDTSLVRFTPTALSVGGSDYVGASVGNYALFAGGFDDNRSNVNAYNTDLVRSITPTPLSVAKYSFAGASVRDYYALFAGGWDYMGGYTDTVDAYDASLVHSTPTALSQGKSSFAGASVGNYALFAGGTSTGGWQESVDAYTLQVSVAILYAPIGTKYKFGESEETATTNEITVPVPLTGYIK